MLTDPNDRKDWDLAKRIIRQILHNLSSRQGFDVLDHLNSRDHLDLHEELEIVVIRELRRSCDELTISSTTTAVGTCQAAAPSGMPAFMYGLPSLPVDITSPVQDAAHAELREFPDEHSR